jgi:hypothetical protein
MKMKSKIFIAVLISLYLLPFNGYSQENVSQNGTTILEGTYKKEKRKGEIRFTENTFYISVPTRIVTYVYEGVFTFDHRTVTLNILSLKSGKLPKTNLNKISFFSYTLKNGILEIIPDKHNMPLALTYAKGKYYLVDDSQTAANNVHPQDNDKSKKQKTVANNVSQSKYEIKQQKKELGYFKKVMNSRSYNTQKHYLGLIENDELLYRIVTEHGDEQIAVNAVDRIKNEETLFKITQKYKRRTTAVKAIKKITSQELLHKIIVENASLQDVVAERIDDENLLYSIAIKSPNAGLSFYQTIIPKIKNQELLYQLTKTVKDNKICTKIAEKISEPEMLKKLVDSLTVTDVRVNAINKITDKSFLYKLALADKNSFIINAVLDKFDEDMFQKIVTDTASNSLKSKAVGKINSQQFLYGLMDNEQLRSYALNRITDQDLLLKIAQENKDWNIRKSAFNKLDNTTLEKVATGISKDQALAVAAKIILKQTDWDKEFSNKSAEYLGQVIGAAALVDKIKPTSANVVSACHTYIKRGDRSRIPELRDLLLRYGDKSLAEDYLNCGNNELYDAAREWGRQHGYNIGAGYGSHRVRWGSAR